MSLSERSLVDEQRALVLRAILVYTAWAGGRAPGAGQLREFYRHLYHQAPPDLSWRLHDLRARGHVELAAASRAEATPVRVLDLGHAWLWKYQGQAAL